MSTKFTPGPWFAAEQSYKASSYYIVGSDSKGNRLSFAKGAVAHIPRSTVMPMNANAQLIAAAPDMFEALESIAEYWNKDRNDQAMFDACWHAIDTAMEALAKARGEQ